MLFTGKILICRPQAQAEKLAHILQSKGWQPIIFPTVDIQPIDSLNKFIPLSSSWTQQADIILIQSPSVLTYLDHISLKLLQSSQVIYAMGQGTQEALLSQGIKSNWVANQGFASEAILSHPPVIDLKLGSKILILTGEGGRSILEPELTKKGFICKRVNTYKRAMPLYTQQQCEKILSQKPDYIIITSVDILKNLIYIFKDYPEILKFKIVVISDRIKQAALELGWQGEILVGEAGWENIPPPYSPSA
jgi:uroporphyrinogen-III synthase